MIDPLRMLRRWRAFRDDVAEEVGFLVERYGQNALAVAREKLSESNLSSSRRKVLAAAIRQLAR
jgi:hypothetical protein